MDELEECTPLQATLVSGDIPQAEFSCDHSVSRG